MDGKATVNGEQSNYSGKWTYNINKLDAWMIYTREKFGERSLGALATMVKNVIFVIHESDKFGDFYRIQNIREGNTPIGISEEELNKFCIKL